MLRGTQLNFLDLAQGNADITQTTGLEPVRTLPRPHCHYAKFADLPHLTLTDSY